MTWPSLTEAVYRVSFRQVAREPFWELFSRTSFSLLLPSFFSPNRLSE